MFQKCQTLQHFFTPFWQLLTQIEAFLRQFEKYRVLGIQVLRWQAWVEVQEEVQHLEDGAPESDVAAGGEPEPAYQARAQVWGVKLRYTAGNRSQNYRVVFF